MNNQDRKLFFPKIQGSLTSYVRGITGNVELEVRFYKLQGSAAKSQLEKMDYNTFQRVFNYYKGIVSYSEKNFTDKIYGDYRLTSHTSSHIANTNATKGTNTSVNANTKNTATKETWSKKTRVADFMDDRFSIKYSVSTEEDDVKPPKSVTSKSFFERKKQRFTFDLGVAKLDMTIVHTSQSGGSGVGSNAGNTKGNMGNRVEYEIELEMNEHKADRVIKLLEPFSVMAQNVWKVIHDTDVLYTIPERKDFISYINQCISGRENKYGSINRIQPQARNLKRRDMVEGGLCLGSINYSVTDKADGERCFVVFSPWGIFIAKSNSLNLAFTYNVDLKPLNVPYVGYVFDAELTYATKDLFLDQGNNMSTSNNAINNNTLGASNNNVGNNSKVKRLLLAFDTVSVPKPNSSIGSLEIQNKPHDFRLDSLKIFYSTVWKDIFWDEASRSNFHFLVKDFLVFETPEQFYQAMKEMTVLAYQRNYKTDGFIFTPVQTPYLLITNEGTPVDKLPLNERVLTEYPDICKLKPVEELTIDFTYDPSTPDTLYSFNPETKSLIAFTGTEKYPLVGYLNQDESDTEGNSESNGEENDESEDGGVEENSELEGEENRGKRNRGEGNREGKGIRGTMDRENELLTQLTEPAIIEFMFDKEKSIFVPTRYRPDKPVPNMIAIAEDVWNDIFEPIHMETYVGHDTVLMTEYHKREIEKYLDGAFVKGGTLIDYGISSLVPLNHYTSENVGNDEGNDDEDNTTTKGNRTGNRTTQENTDGNKALKIFTPESLKKNTVANFAFVYTYDFKIKSQDELFRHIFEHLAPDGFIFYIGLNAYIMKSILDLMQTDSVKLYDYGSMHSIRERKANKMIFNYDPAKATHTGINGGRYGNEKLGEFMIKGEGYAVDDIIKIFDKRGFSLVVGEQLREEKFMNPLEFILSASFSLLIFKKTNKPKIYKPLSPTVERVSRRITDMKLHIMKEDDIASSVSGYRKTSKNQKGVGNVEASISEKRGESVESVESVKSEREAKQHTLDAFLHRYQPKSSEENKEYSGEYENNEYDESISSAEYNKYESGSKVYNPFRAMLGEDDEIDDLECSWFNENLVRIGVIGDGSCMIHSILKALYPAYNDPTLNTSYKEQPLANEGLRTYRIDLATQFRYGLADNLTQMRTTKGKELFAKYESMTKKQLIELVRNGGDTQNDNTTNKNNVGNKDTEKKNKKGTGKNVKGENKGVKVEDADTREQNKNLQNEHKGVTQSALMAMNKEKIITHFLLLRETIFYHYFGVFYEEYRVMDEELKNELSYTPTLSGLESLLKSAAFLGDESYGFLSDVLQTDFVILRATHDDVLFHDTTMKSDSKHKVILINATGSHYELMGMVNEDLQIQTTFAYNDPLILAIRSKFLKQ